MATRKNLVTTDLTQPLDSASLLFSAGPFGWDKDSDARAGTAALKPGMMCYNDATTYSNDYTECAAAHGTTGTQGEICYALGKADSLHTTGDYNLDTVFGDTYQCDIVHLQVGNRVWARGSTLTAAAAQILITGASGIVAAVGQTTGVAVDIAVHAFKVLKAVSAASWVLVEYIGKIAVDNSA